MRLITGIAIATTLLSACGPTESQTVVSPETTIIAPAPEADAAQASSDLSLIRDAARNFKARPPANGADYKVQPELQAAFGRLFNSRPIADSPTDCDRGSRIAYELSNMLIPTFGGADGKLSPSERSALNQFRGLVASDSVLEPEAYAVSAEAAGCFKQAVVEKE